MEFKVNRSALSDALSIAQSCVETKGTIPVLSFALFEMKSGKLQITSTDLDVTLSTEIDAEGDECAVCIPAKQLARIVALLKGDDVTFAFEEKAARVQVKSGSAKHLLPSLDRESYPSFEPVSGPQLIVKASMLVTLLERTIFAVSDEESRYSMRGVYLETKNGKLLATATDGYRMAHIKYPVPFSEEVSAIVPERAVRTILKAFEGDDPVTLKFGQDRVLLTQNNTTVNARTVLAEFPKYEMIIPKERTHEFAVGDAAVNTIKRAELTARKGIANNSHEVFFEVSRASVGVSSRDADRGESEDRFETKCETLNGDSVQLGVASKQLLDLMAHEPEVLFGFNDNKTQFKITPSGLREYEYVYVMMPVRLDA